MKLSIIIPFYANLSHLETAIFHARKAISTVDAEIIVVNDNPTIMIPKELFGGVKVINHTINQGYSFSCNEGAEVAIGKYLFFQDSDVFVEKDCINKLLEYETKYTKGAISACILRSSDFKIHHFGIAFFQTDIIKPYRGGVKETQLFRSDEFQSITSDSMLIERQLFKDCGGFEPELKNSYCDLDFGLKLKDNGGTNVVCLEAISYHRSRSAGLKRTRGQQDNKCAFFKKWGHKINNDFNELFVYNLNTKFFATLNADAFISFCFVSSIYVEKYKTSIEKVTSQRFDWIDIDTENGIENIRLEDYIPWSLITTPKRFLFFVDSIDQLNKNEFLVKNRPRKTDICIDKNANIVYLDKLSVTD